MHYAKICTCGIIIEQCKCPGPKTITIIPHGCDECIQRKQMGLPDKMREVADKTGLTDLHCSKLLSETYGDVAKAIELGNRKPGFLGAEI